MTYYIWHIKWGMYYGPHKGGYYSDVKHAGEYTLEDAIEECNLFNECAGDEPPILALIPATIS